MIFKIEEKAILKQAEEKIQIALQVLDGDSVLPDSMKFPLKAVYLSGRTYEFSLNVKLKETNGS